MTGKPGHSVTTIQSQKINYQQSKQRGNATWDQLGILEESNKNQTCILKEKVYVLVFLINWQINIGKAPLSIIGKSSQIHIWKMLMWRLQENRQNAWCTSSSVGSVAKQNKRHLYSYGTHGCFMRVPKTTRDNAPIGWMSCMTSASLNPTSLHSSSSTREMIQSRPL